MRHAGKEVTRTSLRRALSNLGRYDAGGYLVEFRPGSHYTGSYVSMALLRPNGEVRE
jgi:branched-chain amino acid transport system substrate-binding protein